MFFASLLYSSHRYIVIKALSKIFENHQDLIRLLNLNINSQAILYLENFLKEYVGNMNLQAILFFEKFSKIISWECESASCFILGKFLKSNQVISF